MSIVQTLTKTKNLFEDPKIGMAKGLFASNADKDYLDIDSPEATHFCIWGAMQKVAHGHENLDSDVVWSSLIEVGKTLYDEGNRPNYIGDDGDYASVAVDWNNETAEDKHDLIAVIDRTIHRMEAAA